MKSKIIKVLSLSLTMLATLTVITGCDDNKDSSSTSDEGYNRANETTPVVFATQDLDGLFNPFYYTSGTDGTIVGMTQLSMFTTDKNGAIAYGKDYASLVLDYEDKYDANKDQTTYTFVLKNPVSNWGNETYDGVRFSDGSYVTLKDVLFNMYEYLDPAYTGSSTMYSTDIIGLQEYRTQQATEEGQEAFENKFTLEAEDRVSNLINVIAMIEEENSMIDTANEYKEALRLKAIELAGNENYKYADKFVEDFEYIGETFKEELNTDYTNNMGSYEDDLDLCNDIEMFLYAEGLITIDQEKEVGDPDRVTYALGKDWPYENEDGTVVKVPYENQNSTNKTNYKPVKTKEEAINVVYESNYPSEIATIANYWATATTIRETFKAKAKEDYFKNNAMPYKSISGIQVITSDTTINGKNYKYALYDSDGTRNTTYGGSDNGYEMFSITIDGVDPKAIWNFSFGISPMYYYSNQEQIAAFNYGLDSKNDPAFGVVYSSTDFQTNVIKNNDKIGLPVGAGAYQASNADSNLNNVAANTFYKDQVVYYERNPYFLMGSPKIRMLRYKVVSSNQMLNSLFQGEVHYCDPSAKQEVINQLNNKRNDGFSYSQTETLGYGYIGINAHYIPDIWVRRAIMVSMDTSLTLDYYPGTAEVLYRPMSSVSWAYPKGVGPYKNEEENLDYSFDKTGNRVKQYLELGGYSQNSKGIMVDSSGKQLELTYTISGETDDHPTAKTFYASQSMLNALGCKVTVKTDKDALKKLSEGSLAIWAAAWSTTIDPDMYQTYHKDSQASSTTNWGYKDILNNAGGKYDTELEIVNELSEYIDKGRETTDRNARTETYAKCLDLVMELAVELPTYQRDDLFAYNTSVIDKRTLTPEQDISAYNGPISEIWNLSLVNK